MNYICLMPINPTLEDRIQQEIYMDFHNRYCLPIHEPQLMMFAVPNQNQQHLTSIGVTAGVSDLEILGLESGPVFVEVKTPTGTQSKKQKEFQQRVERMGHTYLLVRSLEEFNKAIKPYMHV